jgi:hypothetical protein
MTDFDFITEQALKLTAAVVQAGGMATKSFLEDWLIKHNPGLSKVDARYITNQIEFNNRRYNGKVDLAEFPDVEFEGRSNRAVLGKVPESKGHLFFFRRIPDGPIHELFETDEGATYTAPISNVIDIQTGSRSGRWEADGWQKALVLENLKPRKVEI